MANKTYADLAVKLDSSAGTLTTITCQINSVELEGTQTTIDDTTICDTEMSVLPGIAGARLTLNGVVNSTTDDMFGPLIGNRTSITKTAEFYNGLKYYNGEFLPTSVRFSGTKQDMQTWSAELVLDGAANRTSVGL